MAIDPFTPSERGPTNDEIIAEAKRISDLEWEGNEEHADFFGPLLFRLQADTSWFKPEPEVDEETYKIGFDDGYSEAVQDIDRRTGGDGEYFASTIPGEGCPDPATMILKIADRFEALAKRPRVDVPGEVIEAARYYIIDHPTARSNIMARFILSLSQEPRS